MSNIEKSEKSDEKSIEKSKIVQPKIPMIKVQAMFQELEMMAMQKGDRNSLDLSKSNKG